MSSSNVIIPPDWSKLILDREKIWDDYDRSQSMVGNLGQMAKQIPDCAPADIQMQFGPDSLPTTELETLVPKVREQIETASRLKAEVQGCHNEIAAIKQKEKTTIIVMAVAGAVVLLVLLIVIIAIVSSIGSSR
jgi:hypothetical protein